MIVYSLSLDWNSIFCSKMLKKFHSVKIRHLFLRMSGLFFHRGIFCFHFLFLSKKEVLTSRPLTESWAKLSCKMMQTKKWAKKRQKIAQSERNEQESCSVTYLSMFTNTEINIIFPIKLLCCTALTSWFWDISGNLLTMIWPIFLFLNCFEYVYILAINWGGGYWHYYIMLYNTMNIRRRCMRQLQIAVNEAVKESVN